MSINFNTSDDPAIHRWIDISIRNSWRFILVQDEINQLFEPYLKKGVKISELGAEELAELDGLKKRAKENLKRIPFYLHQFIRVPRGMTSDQVIKDREFQLVLLKKAEKMEDILIFLASEQNELYEATSSSSERQNISA